MSILFITPLVVLVAAVTIVPILSAIRWSLHETSYANMREFIGFENYISIFSPSRGGDALISIANSLWYVPQKCLAQIGQHSKIPVVQPSEQHCGNRLRDYPRQDYGGAEKAAHPEILVQKDRKEYPQRNCEGQRTKGAPGGSCSAPSWKIQLK